MVVELLQLRKKGQVTLPLSLRKQLGLQEGDFLAVEIRDNEVILHPKKLIDADQAWFWSDSWQAGEKEASEDIRDGRVQAFGNAAEAIAFLHEQSAKKPASA
jgi:AbrB family looped-hinge helix DNA binding protein